MTALRLRPRDQSEDEIHEDVRRMLDVALVAPACWTSIEHRNARDAIEGAKRKARGVRAGVPDVLIVYGRITHYIELKTRTGSLSQSQIEMRAALVAAGAPWALCRSVDDVIRQVQAWGIPIRVASAYLRREG